ncbi:membrane protein [Streptomyces albospinus]|uniref:Membrane protein n=1 Tax=Streptomyces albospinus TaxID=285515 RepID=A0ABQ2VHF3_9ACTN|nr:membrane protein [Streptomyces albospinus]
MAAQKLRLRAFGSSIGTVSDPVVPARSDGFRGPLRRLAAPAATLTAVCAAFALVGAVDPNEPGHYPVCPLLHLTGIYCPACGGLRSAYAVAHGDLTAALGANALAVAGYAAFALFWLVWLTRAARGRRTAGPRPRPVHWWALGGLLLAFTAVRNLPFGAGLHP